MAYTVKKQIRQGLPQVGVKPYRQVHAHSTGNPNSTAQNEADYHDRRPVESGFFQYVVGDGVAIQTAPLNMGAYDVGGGWNAETYAAVELIESHKTKAEFERDYAIYCELLRDLANQGGIPVTLDTPDLAGIKTHNYCTHHQPNNFSDHVDPIPYLAKWGISQAQFAKDLATKVAGGTNAKPTITAVAAKVTTQSVSDNTGQKVNQGIYTVDDLQKVNGIWQVRCNFLVPVDFSWTDNGIAVDDIVLVDKNGYVLKDQTTKTGSLFVFDTNCIKSVGAPINGSGGYLWCKVNLKSSGGIWLSVTDKNDLIHKISKA